VSGLTPKYESRRGGMKLLPSMRRQKRIHDRVVLARWRELFARQSDRLA